MLTSIGWKRSWYCIGKWTSSTPEKCEGDWKCKERLEPHLALKMRGIQEGNEAYEYVVAL